MVVRLSPFLCHHFGRPEYDRNLPILSDRIKKQAQPIVDALNDGTLDLETAKKRLDKI
jgi:hypothetical protein